MFEVGDYTIVPFNTITNSVKHPNQPQHAQNAGDELGCSATVCGYSEFESSTIKAFALAKATDSRVAASLSTSTSI